MSLVKLGPDILALILFTLFWMVLISIYGGKIHFVDGSTVLPSIILAGIIVATWFTHIKEKRRLPIDSQVSLSQRLKRVLRDWLPLIFLVAVYETLRDYTGIIRPDSIDQALLEMDILLFGVEPTIWIQQFVTPFWTDYFALMYMLYFALPMFVATLLYLKGRKIDFRELALSVVICMYTGYILYLIFPAGPPRFYTDIVFDPEKLTGYFGFYDFTQSQMDNSSHVMLKSSFPSLHCALSLLAVFHAFRFGDVWRRKYMVAINLWIAASIWIATVYLRHHWVVDIFAGWILAVFAYYKAQLTVQIWAKIDPKYVRS